MSNFLDVPSNSKLLKYTIPVLVLFGLFLAFPILRAGDFFVVKIFFLLGLVTLYGRFIKKNSIPSELGVVDKLVAAIFIFNLAYLDLVILNYILPIISVSLYFLSNLIISGLSFLTVASTVILFFLGLVYKNKYRGYMWMLLPFILNLVFVGVIMAAQQFLSFDEYISFEVASNQVINLINFVFVNVAYLSWRNSLSIGKENIVEDILISSIPEQSIPNTVEISEKRITNNKPNIKKVFIILSVFCVILYIFTNSFEEISKTVKVVTESQSERQVVVGRLQSWGEKVPDGQMFYTGSDRWFFSKYGVPLTQSFYAVDKNNLIPVRYDEVNIPYFGELRASTSSIQNVSSLYPVTDGKDEVYFIATQTSPEATFVYYLSNNVLIPVFISANSNTHFHYGKDGYFYTMIFDTRTQQYDVYQFDKGSLVKKIGGLPNSISPSSYYNSPFYMTIDEGVRFMVVSEKANLNIDGVSVSTTTSSIYRLNDTTAAKVQIPDDYVFPRLRESGKDIYVELVDRADTSRKSILFKLNQDLSLSKVPNVSQNLATRVVSEVRSTTFNVLSDEGYNYQKEVKNVENAAYIQQKTREGSFLGRARCEITNIKTKKLISGIIAEDSCGYFYSNEKYSILINEVYEEAEAVYIIENDRALRVKELSDFSRLQLAYNKSKDIWYAYGVKMDGDYGIYTIEVK